MKLLRIFWFPVLLFPSLQAFAWGERGHDAIARIAARMGAEDPATKDGSWSKLLVKKEHMLGHLSNVPDIVWRQIGPEVDAPNSPSHFIHLEHLQALDPKVPTKYPRNFSEYVQRLDEECKKSSDSSTCPPGENSAEKTAAAGHAPFRIQGLMQNLVAALKDVKQSEGNPKADTEARNAAVDRALLQAGILAHFVGDLANPHHTTTDYDGWLSGGGGLHRYFENDVVDILGLDLDLAISNEIRKKKPASKLFAGIDKDPLLMSWVLALDSRKHLEQLIKLDAHDSILKQSVNEPKTPAARREPKLVGSAYKPFIVERLALGADALRTFWNIAWEEAGKPDLSFYKSSAYPVRPEFIPLGYWPPK